MHIYPPRTYTEQHTYALSQVGTSGRSKADPCGRILGMHWQGVVAYCRTIAGQDTFGICGGRQCHGVTGRLLHECWSSICDRVLCVLRRRVYTHVTTQRFTHNVEPSACSSSWWRCTCSVIGCWRIQWPQLLHACSKLRVLFWCCGLGIATAPALCRLIATLDWPHFLLRGNISGCTRGWECLVACPQNASSSTPVDPGFAI